MVIPMGESYIRLEIPVDDIIYDGKVKRTYSGQGIVRVPDIWMGHVVYVVFPMGVVRSDFRVTVAVDEIISCSVRPNTNNTSRVMIGKEYVGRDCIIIFKED